MTSNLTFQVVRSQDENGKNVEKCKKHVQSVQSYCLCSLNMQIYGVLVAVAVGLEFTVLSQGPEETFLSLEHQNPSKTSEIMGYFDRVDDRVTVSLHILYTANQETEGSQDRLTV